MSERARADQTRERIHARIYGLVQHGALVCAEWQDPDGQSAATMSCGRCGYSADVHLLKDALSAITAPAPVAPPEALRADLSTPSAYDTTVARIAGNIASGLASKADDNGSGLMGVEGLRDWANSITLMSVSLARAIVAEVKRTEPSSPQEQP